MRGFGFVRVRAEKKSLGVRDLSQMDKFLAQMNNSRQQACEL